MLGIMNKIIKAREKGNYEAIKFTGDNIFDVLDFIGNDALYRGGTMCGDDGFRFFALFSKLNTPHQDDWGVHAMPNTYIVKLIGDKVVTRVYNYENFAERFEMCE